MTRGVGRRPRRLTLRPHAHSRLLLALGALLSLALLGAACDTSAPSEETPQPEGGHSEEIVTDDGVALSARLWPRSEERVAIYLHEFRLDQSSWWPFVEDLDQPGAPEVSALTFDFRGHGASEGKADDTAAMVRDVLAAVDFAHALGYEHVMLVGAGMGAAVAVVAAAEAPQVTVIGLSTPADFDTIDTVAVVEHLDERVHLIAARDDVSAADSLHRFRSLGAIDSVQTRLYPGRAHGVAILDAESGAEVRERFEELLDEFWVPVRG